MANAVQKIVLSASRDIPFNKLVLSQSNVRRMKAGIFIEEFAEDRSAAALDTITLSPRRDHLVIWGRHHSAFRGRQQQESALTRSSRAMILHKSKGQVSDFNWSRWRDHSCAGAK